MLARTTRYFREHPWQRLVVIVLAVGSAGVLVIGLGYRWTHRGTPTEWGVSFSTKYARELGIDGRDSYLYTLDELGFDRVRLMSYWDEHEPTDGEYAFEELDWQFDQAAARGIDVLLAVGMRQPRWPECHVPEWTADLPDATFRAELVDYLGVVVERYQDHPALAGYHLENEAANRSFGHCPALDHRLLVEEFQTIKALDPNTPVTLSVSNQYGIPLRGPIADAYAMSIYREAHFELFGRTVNWNYSFVPSWWHGFRAGLMEWLHDSPVYVHELQTEPWGERATVDLTLEEQAETMDPARLITNTAYAKRIGVETIDLWGAEWWYWRSEEFDDPSLHSAVMDVTAATE